MMKVLRWALLVASYWPVQVASNPNCPIYGAEFPNPRQVADMPGWKAAMKNLSDVFDGVEAAATNYSFSVQIFSTNPGPPILFERFHTAQTLPSNTTGVKKVDADTVYRIGSVTKLFTVLAFLAEAGDKYFNHPITDFVPELAEISAKRANTPLDNLRTVDWDDINIQSLLAQMSGIERDCEYYPDGGSQPTGCIHVPPCCPTQCCLAPVHLTAIGI
jgi:CubicO group peptidase (beta-lactamase class C family)